MTVSEAARISMSISLFFAAVKNAKGCYVDGGLFENCPIKLFDRIRYIDHPENARETAYNEIPNQRRQAKGNRLVYNKETLGFHLDSTFQIATFRDGAHPIAKLINDFTDYLRALMSAVLNVQDNQHLHSDDWNRGQSTSIPWEWAPSISPSPTTANKPSSSPDARRWRELFYSVRSTSDRAGGSGIKKSILIALAMLLFGCSYGAMLDKLLSAGFEEFALVGAVTLIIA